MLYKRILTAIPLAILAIWFILNQSSTALLYALLVVNLIAGWEWSRLSGVSNSLMRAVYAVLVSAASYGIYLYLQTRDDLFVLLMAISVIWWLVLIYRMSVRDPEPASDQLSSIKLVAGLVTLIPPLLAIIHIHSLDQGAYWLLYVLSIVWIADTGAYFSGKRFGKVKLVPKLSPGKTREGMYGAILATSLYSLAAATFFELDFIRMLLLLIISFFATLYSIAGDLFISLLKRERGVKDSGTILPGHGGVLDRIDSITSSAPFFALLLGLMIFNV